MKYLDNLHGNLLGRNIECKGVVNVDSKEVLIIVHILQKVG